MRNVSYFQTKHQKKNVRILWERRRIVKLGLWYRSSQLLSASQVRYRRGLTKSEGGVLVRATFKVKPWISCLHSTVEIIIKSCFTGIVYENSSLLPSTRPHPLVGLGRSCFLSYPGSNSSNLVLVLESSRRRVGNLSPAPLVCRNLCLYSPCFASRVYCASARLIAGKEFACKSLERYLKDCLKSWYCFADLTNRSEPSLDSRHMHIRECLPQKFCS